MKPNPKVSSLLAVLRQVQRWCEFDLMQYGAGPSGGFQIRLDTVTAAIEKAERVA
jgi:hypothetical protein